MSKRKTPKTSKKRVAAAPSKAPPKALQKRAREAHGAKLQKLAIAGFEAIDIVLDRRRNIASNFFDMGTALLVLRREGMPDALGYADFEAICRTKLDMTAQHADRLIAVATRIARDLALKLGIERCSALLAIADATPDDDTPADIVHATLVVPGGRRVVIDKASTPELWEAAKAFRQANAAPGKRGRGLTTSAEERGRFAALEKVLAGDATFAEVSQKLVARGKLKGAAVRADVPLALWEAMVAAVAGRKKPRTTRVPGAGKPEQVFGTRRMR